MSKIPFPVFILIYCVTAVFSVMMVFPLLVSLVNWDFSIAIDYYERVFTIPQLWLAIRIILASGFFMAFIIGILYAGTILLEKYSK